MRNDRVLIPVLHVAHDANVFRLMHTCIFIENYPTNLFYHKMPTFELYEYKVEGSGCGFNRKQDLAETYLKFIKKIDTF